jgi:hypothetical protein
MRATLSVADVARCQRDPVVHPIRVTPEATVGGNLHLHR